MEIKPDHKPEGEPGSRVAWAIWQDGDQPGLQETLSQVNSGSPASTSRVPGLTTGV